MWADSAGAGGAAAWAAAGATAAPPPLLPAPLPCGGAAALCTLRLRPVTLAPVAIRRPGAARGDAGGGHLPACIGSCISEGSLATLGRVGNYVQRYL